MTESEMIIFIKDIPVKDGLEVLEAYRRKHYTAGARSLAKLVRNMRFKQKDYLRDRLDSALKISNKLEAQVDRAVEAILK